MTEKGQTYFEIVWRQLRKNKPAIVALWVVLFLFVIATLTPVMASYRPFVYSDEKGTIFPWVNQLFNPENFYRVHNPIDLIRNVTEISFTDYLFNMALVVSPLWFLISAALLWRHRGRGAPFQRTVFQSAAVYLGLTMAAMILFSYDKIRPKNPYFQRDFKQEVFEKPDSRWGIFPPIPFQDTEQDTYNKYRQPLTVKIFEAGSAPTRVYENSTHWLGTDGLGRDITARMLYGSRVSLTVGFVAVSIYVFIGIIVGALAGYFGGWIDILISRLIEIMMMFPTLFLVLIMVAFLGPNVYNVMFVIGITGWTGIARLIRGEFLKQRGHDYVTAARALGASSMRIIFRHILPNALHPILVAAPFGIAGAVITEATLSVLGFGARPPTPSWGTVLNEAMEHYTFWWLIMFPGLAIFVAVTAFNLLGSGLRDAIDPRLKNVG